MSSGHQGYKLLARQLSYLHLASLVQLVQIRSKTLVSYGPAPYTCQVIEKASQALDLLLLQAHD